MKERTPLNWGKRFKEYLKVKGSSLAKVAEKLGRAESTVRSWTNGTREINLSEFLELCQESKIDPAVVLFSSDKPDGKFLVIGQAWGQATPFEREVLLTAAKGVLAQHESEKRGTGTS